MYNKLIYDEYLITNGIGGFSSASLTGANTRKYHAILNASLNPPVNRQVLLSKIETVIKTNKKTHTLESVEYENSHLDHTGYMKSYSHFPIPTFVYHLEDIVVTKRLAMAYGHNTTAVEYQVKTGHQPITLKCFLQVNNRDHHDLSEEGSFVYDLEIQDKTLSLSSDQLKWTIQGFGDYHFVNQWAKPEFYPIEARRGQAYLDSNYRAGYYEITIPANTYATYSIVASTEVEFMSSDEIIAAELKRRDDLTKDEDPIAYKLQLACDQFIVDRKSTHSKTVIAGYPWFTDWGRDTMIALPGLTLATKRYSDAKDIIRTFIKYEKNGLIPNMFPDDNVEPMYNTIDGSLWLFVAVYQYFKATKDSAFIKEIFSSLDKMIAAHIKGTDYNIHVDFDGLLSGGDETTQLTWMDVKIDGVVVTPRHGKAVEINALWFNALHIMAFLKDELHIKSQTDFLKYADLCFKGFNDQFWNDKQNCLYDLIQDGQPIDHIRPNQIFAVSLPFSLLNKEKEKAVLKIVKDKLLTPNGLRSLAKDDPLYKGIYDGDVYKRDYAYHQGTVWAWLIGPYLEAHYNVYKDTKYLTDKLNLFLQHLDHTGIGTISEVFSGDYPHDPRGCFAQAWSVSEAMRIYRIIKDKTCVKDTF